MLEAGQYEDNCFLTLTYSDEFLPASGSLNPRHTQLFLKKLRKQFAPRKFRYFLVGEYGDETERAHYHAALFGYPTCRKGVTHRNRSDDCCDVCDGLRDVWSMGRVHLGQLAPESAQYIAGYVTKKLTRKDDERLGGRHPEFARFSLKPGLGHGIVDELASTILFYNLEGSMEDVAVSLRHGSRLLPLGRYLRRELRKRLGREETTPEKALEEYYEDLQSVWEVAKTTAPRGQVYLTFKNLLVERNQGQHNRTNSKYKPKNKGSI